MHTPALLFPDARTQATTEKTRPTRFHHALARVASTKPPGPRASLEAPRRPHLFSLVGRVDPAHMATDRPGC
ncbi:hypothetical protein GQ53DRAFT_750147 [Thozetella sp. PMI_491]|nr:hypothetical protein GQ53DRAFT_750147 [Thozetella sp. PMI_491]